MKPKRLLYKRRTTAEILDESISNVIRLEEAGILDVVILRPNGVVHHRAEQVDTLAKGSPDIERKQFGPKPAKVERLKLIRRGA
jgi:hypothetical protein